jgi:predicted short-subunit dehydrogenase-like oxidoreductase (DUF2520 family)
MDVLTNLDDIGSHFDLIILAVRDDAIQSLADILSKYDLGNSIVAHTSGVASIDRLDVLQRYGLFYPLDSFGYDGDHNLKETPILIEGSEGSVLDMLRVLAEKLSEQVNTISENDRQYLHLAAVWANNFVNAILRKSFDILDEKHIDRGLINKLIRTTTFKALELGPENSQTGPAKRNDIESITKHLALTADDKTRELYKTLSSIINEKLKGQL